MKRTASRPRYGSIRHRIVAWMCREGGLQTVQTAPFGRGSVTASQKRRTVPSRDHRERFPRAGLERRSAVRDHRPMLRFLRSASAVLLAASCHASVYPPGVTSKDVARLMQSTAYVRSLDEAALRKLVPAQSGLNYVGCPNCNSGQQENQLAWTPDRPGEVYCQYCNHRYPSSKYPMDQALTVRNPRGETQRYPYWADAQGYRYYFEARRDDL